MLGCPLGGGLTMAQVYRVPKIVTASLRVVLGRFPSLAVLSLLSSSSPIVDEFSGILNITQMCPGMALGL